MNAAEIMESPPTKALTVAERAAVALNSSEHERKLLELAQASKSITGITNPAGREQCHGARMALKRVRVEIEKTGKAAREEATTFSKAVIAEERRLIALTEPEEIRLTKIQDDYDERIAAEKRAKAAAEAQRVAAIRARIEAIRETALEASGRASVHIATVIAALEATIIDKTFAEFQKEAEGAKASTLVRLQLIHSNALTVEAEQKRLVEERAELARQRAADELRAAQERERLAEEQRRAREAAAAEAARKAREKAEAERKAAEEKRRAEEAERRKAQEAENARLKAERDAAEARARGDREARERAEQEAKEARERAAAAEKAARDAAASAARFEARATTTEQRGAERAEALQAQAATVVAPIVQAEIPKVSGISNRDNWKAEVYDLMATVKAVAAGQASIALLAYNEKVLGQQARSLKEHFVAPGIRVWNDRTKAAGAA